MKRLILMGAGHAHLIALKQWITTPLDDVELVLVTPSRWQYYSGMIPGWIAGHYTIDQCRVDAEPVAKAAGAKLVLSSVVEILADDKKIRLADGDLLDYSWLSIDIGARTNLENLRGFTGSLLSIKPLGQFHQQWSRLNEASDGRVQHLVVVGGGAAGAELAMAMAHVGAGGAEADARVSLITGNQGLLPDFSQRLRKLTRRKLAKLDVDIVEERAEAAGRYLTLTNGTSLDPDLVMAVTGSEAFPFLATSGLAVDAQGFVLVNECHQSLSHPDVFAAGDACSRLDQAVKRSGVHAVRAAPVLADNLRAAIASGKLRAFQPRTNTLYLIACGDKVAVGSYGPFSFSGKWVWRLKDKIDRGFVDGFNGRSNDAGIRVGA
ncbi:FAD-dependent oxidoreductase [Marinobacter sp. AL4B]|uniref:FAD-dependent oxidoreductase n=1 Tax=Marinobacter sp. AL4B TaxID=2871173 RepID=UPI001CAA5A8F|nr:FAD-dependent oxidoreductase [Marinobacter sp. AL4B]MBZ0334088.1 FAD-dependent oxidoreductase [Marinobacter sp. AL4B]